MARAKATYEINTTAIALQYKLNCNQLHWGAQEILITPSTSSVVLLDCLAVRNENLQLLNWSQTNSSHCAHTMRFTFRSFYSLVLAIQSTTVIELISLEFINFNRYDICVLGEAFSISKAKSLKLYAMNRREET